MSDGNYSRITVKVHNTWHFKDVVKKAAEQKGESVNGYMIRAIHDAVRADGMDFPTVVLEGEKNTSNNNDE